MGNVAIDWWPFPFDGGKGNIDEFIASMETRMIRKLSQMRAGTEDPVLEGHDQRG